MNKTPNNSGRRGKFNKVRTAKGRKLSSTLWIQRQINDPYVAAAREQGYRSRAAFKLIEIDKKYKLLEPGHKIVDLGAAPGGWSQIAVQKVGKNNVLAIDILEMEPISGVHFIQQDFMAENALEKLNKEFKDWLGQDKESLLCDSVISDMAANSCGDSKTDHLRIVAMLEESLYFAYQILKDGGSFVGKIFQGGAQGELLQELRRNFESVKHFKPDSSRKKSAENYIIAKGYRGRS